MDHDDPILSYVFMPFVWVHAICVLCFKVEHVLLILNCVKSPIAIQSTSINSCWDCNIWSYPKSYNIYYVHFCVPWILEVDSNDPNAGTTNDCICLLLSTLHPCRYSFHMQAMIFARSCELFFPAIASVVYCMVPGCKGQHFNLAG